MKVTKQELYLVGFFHLANLAKDPFEAFIMNDMFKDQFIDLTKHRRDTLAFLQMKIHLFTHVVKEWV